jgi:hypothetical protein
MFGISGTSLTGVSIEGGVATWNGSAWSVIDAGTHALGGSVSWLGPDELYATRVDSRLLWHYQGGAWTTLGTPSTQPLVGVFATPTHVFAISRCERLRFDGATWDELTDPPCDLAYYEPLHTLWGFTASDVWVVRDTKWIYRYDGAAWRFDSTIPESPHMLWPHAIAGSSDDDVWTAGSGGLEGRIVHWDGTEWTVVESPVEPIPGPYGGGAQLMGIYAGGADDVWFAALR